MNYRIALQTPSPPNGSGWRSLFLSLSLLAIVPIAPVWAQLDKNDTAPIAKTSTGGFLTAERTVQSLAPGIEWTQEITPASVPGGPLVVNVIRVSPQAAKKDKLRVALGYGRVWEKNSTQGRETVAGIARRYNALVAVNAGFFTYTGGNPLGISIENGEAITEPMMGRTALLIQEDGRGKVAAFTGSGTVTAEDGATYSIAGFNRKPGKGNEMLLFTPRFFDATLSTPDRIEVALSGIPALVFNSSLPGTVTQIGNGGGTSLASQTVVLSGSGTAALFLSQHATLGKPFTVRYQVSPDLDKVRQAVAGGPRLVADGKVSVNDAAEGFAGAFSTGRHPRTATGVTKDGSVLLLTVDGRQPLLSKGATLAETAALLVKFGAVEGVNLDGGGSTTLAVEGVVANSPSETSERPVANALILTTDEKPQDHATDETALPALPPMKVGQTQQCNLPLSSTDADTDDRVWGMRGNIGFVSQSGKFLALRAGSGTILVTLKGGHRYAIPVEVTAPPTPTPVSPPTPKPAP